MFRTVPTTIAGIAALVAYVRDCESSGDDILDLYMDDGSEETALPTFLDTLAASLQQTIRRQWNLRTQRNNVKPTILDRPPPGWFVFAVMRERGYGWDWIALMTDVDPDLVPFRGSSRHALVRIPGKFRSRAAACDALPDMVATRHWGISPEAA
jgi:hypothetical protein